MVHDLESEVVSNSKSLAASHVLLKEWIKASDWYPQPA